MRSREMTYRVVPLGSREASSAHLGMTASQRLNMLEELSHMTWVATGLPLPTYSRAEMPVTLSTLREQGSSTAR
ncbi:MAG: hypothetical protein JWM95_1477 [Gemmatimonadetes bacterium]|nr:hypothetical protein [Gemmatimonadota bacterium]